MLELLQRFSSATAV